MHVTGYLGDEPRDRVLRFLDTAVGLRYFDEVTPVRRGDGTIIAVAMYSRTLGQVDPAAVVSDICRRLGGILGRDTEFATAWDPAGLDGEVPVTATIRGRGVGTVPGLVVTDSGELSSADGVDGVRAEG